MVIFAVASCNEDAATTPKTDSKDSTIATTDSMNYPYTIKDADTWERGSPTHLECFKSSKSLLEWKY